jgi:hypothetical protein
VGFAIFLIFGILASVGLAWQAFRSRGMRHADFDTLIAALQPISVRGVELIARDFLEPASSKLRQTCSQTWLEPGDIWSSLGEKEGLRRMSRNAEVMVRLAAYVQAWDRTEAYVVAQRIRQDALEMKRALVRIRIISLFGWPERRVPLQLQRVVAIHLQRVASSYYLMRERLLLLYETKQFVCFQRLSDAL